MYTPSIARKQFQIADITLDPNTGQVWQDEEEITLPKLSFQLLRVLAENAPNVLEQEELIAAVWPDLVISNETLKQRVRLLRKAIGDNAQSPQYIAVVRGRGYRLIPQVVLKLSQYHPSIVYDLASSDHVPDILTAATSKLWRRVSLGLSSFIIILLSLLVILNQHFEQQSQLRPLKNLAILPFVNLTTNQEDDYLASGMTNELIKVMSEIESLNVTPNNEVKSFRRKERVISNIAQQLDVGAILDGTLYSRSGLTHFSFKLLDTNNLAQLWQAEYNFESHDILTIQREVITQVSHHLKAKLNKSTLFDSLSLRQPTKVIKAYDFYLRGREYYYRYRKADNLTAITLFKKALEFDDNFALAHAGLSDAYGQAVFQFGGDDAWRALALQSAQTAVSLDNNKAESHKALGLAQFLNGYIDKAIESNLRAIKLSPRHTQAVTNLAYIYNEKGDLAQAMQWNLRAIELTPNYPPVYVHLGRTLQNMQNDNLAKENYLKALQLQPDYALAIGHYAQVLAQNDQFDSAQRTMIDALDNAPTEIALLARMAEIQLNAGRFPQAEIYLQKAINQNGQHFNFELEFLKAICQAANGVNLLTFKTQTQQWQDTRLVNNQTPRDFYLMALALAVTGDFEHSADMLVLAINRGWRGFSQLRNNVLLKPVGALKQVQHAISIVNSKSI